MLQSLTAEKAMLIAEIMLFFSVQVVILPVFTEKNVNVHKRVKFEGMNILSPKCRLVAKQTM